MSRIIKFLKRLLSFLFPVKKPKVEKKTKVEERPGPRFIKIKLSTGITHAEVVKENPLTYLVRLSGGKIIKRHKARQVL